jgi:hypothetical protein
MQGREDSFDDAVEAAETVRSRYTAVWEELHLEPEVAPGDRHAIRARIRRLNDLGFAIDEVLLEPTSATADAVRLRVAVANRRFHAHRLQKLTGLVALEGQARLLLNDIREYQCWIETSTRTTITVEATAERWFARGAPTGDRRAGAGDRAIARSGPGVLRRARRSGCCPRRRVTTWGSMRPWLPTRSSERRPEARTTLPDSLDRAGHGRSKRFDRDEDEDVDERAWRNPGLSRTGRRTLAVALTSVPREPSH